MAVTSDVSGSFQLFQWIPSRGQGRFDHSTFFRRPRRLLPLRFVGETGERRRCGDDPGRHIGTVGCVASSIGARKKGPSALPQRQAHPQGGAENVPDHHIQDTDQKDKKRELHAGRDLQ